MRFNFQPIRAPDDISKNRIRTHIHYYRTRTNIEIKTVFFSVFRFVTFVIVFVFLFLYRRHCARGDASMRKLTRSSFWSLQLFFPNLIHVTATERWRGFVFIPDCPLPAWNAPLVDMWSKPRAVRSERSQQQGGGGLLDSSRDSCSCDCCEQANDMNISNIMSKSVIQITVQHS